MVPLSRATPRLIFLPDTLQESECEVTFVYACISRFSKSLSSEYRRAILLCLLHGSNIVSAGKLGSTQKVHSTSCRSTSPDKRCLLFSGAKGVQELVEVLAAGQRKLAPYEKPVIVNSAFVYVQVACNVFGFHHHAKEYAHFKL